MKHLSFFTRVFIVCSFLCLFSTTEQVLSQSCLSRCSTTPMEVSSGISCTTGWSPDVDVYHCCDNVYPYANIVCVVNNHATETIYVDFTLVGVTSWTGISIGPGQNYGIDTQPYVFSGTWEIEFG